MPLDYTLITCPFCGGDVRLYDGEQEGVCEECDVVVEEGMREEDDFGPEAA